MFSTADADKIGSLKQFAGRSEPTFLFYAKNVLVHIDRGINGPSIERKIKEELTKERACVEKGIARVPLGEIAAPEVAATLSVPFITKINSLYFACMCSQMLLHIPTHSRHSLTLNITVRAPRRYILMKSVLRVSSEK